MTLTEDLVGRAAARHYWHKTALARFCRKEECTPEEITALVDRLTADTFPSTDNIAVEDIPGGAGSGELASLTSLGEIVGVNALLPGQTEVPPGRGGSSYKERPWRSAERSSTRSARTPQSGPIGALAVARAARREGIDTLPTARLSGPELEIRLLVVHRERLVDARSRLICELRWQLHDLWPDWKILKQMLVRVGWQGKPCARLYRASLRFNYHLLHSWACPTPSC